MFSQNCSAIGDTGAVMVITLVVPGERRGAEAY